MCAAYLARPGGIFTGYEAKGARNPLRRLMGHERSDTHTDKARETVMDGEIKTSVYRKILNRLTHLPIYATVGSVDEIMCSTEPSHVDRRGLFQILENLQQFVYYAGF
jgi:hypothetical protein